MEFLVEYLDKETFHSISRLPIEEYAGKTKTVVVQSDWDDVVENALKKPGVFQVIAIHLECNYWGANK